MVIEPFSLIIVFSSGFIERINPDRRDEIIIRALKHISPDTRFIVFDPRCSKPRYEDGGASLILPSDYPQKVYTYLDDYGDPKTLSDKIGYRVATQYTLTFLLPDEW